jgi:hypothetical protein
MFNNQRNSSDCNIWEKYLVSNILLHHNEGSKNQHEFPTRSYFVSVEGLIGGGKMYGFGIHIVVKILFCRQRMDATETNRPTC